MKITSTTQYLGLIGYPLAHSKSAQIMNAALAELNEPYLYLSLPIEPAKLGQGIDGIKVLPFLGCNVTIPFKERVIPYLDACDEQAKAIGAVNTLVHHQGQWIGYNTDGQGYMQSLLEDTTLCFKDTRVVILGAGGAALAIAYNLMITGVKQITIANRTLDRAKVLASKLSYGVSTKAVSIYSCRQEIAMANLVINTTSVGLFPHVSLSPIELDWLHPNLWVSDIIYHPKETALLQGAKKAGANIHYGQGMLIHQAALALELWLKKPAPVHIMKEALTSS